MTVITIGDPASGASATILPELGFNCYSFRVPVAGREVETLWAEPEFGPGHRPSRSGIPILFPFAGRIRNGRYRWQGRDYVISGAQANNGNAIHGFVMTRPWRVTEQTANRATATFQASIDDRSLLDQWPADFRITVSYQVAGATLRADVVIENPDERPLPFGFGTHPYFRLPLGGSAAAECRVRVPAASMAVQTDQLPTGEVSPVDQQRDLRAGPRFGGLTLDDILLDLDRGADGRVRTSITDPETRLAVEQVFDAAFAACIVFTPPHRQAIAIEPYTTLPNPFELLDQGADPHLLTLAPGEQWRGRIDIRVVTAESSG